jgi:hypothetical protein
MESAKGSCQILCMNVRRRRLATLSMTQDGKRPGTVKTSSGLREPGAVIRTLFGDPLRVTLGAGLAVPRFSLAHTGPKEP